MRIALIDDWRQAWRFHTVIAAAALGAFDFVMSHLDLVEQLLSPETVAQLAAVLPPDRVVDINKYAAIGRFIVLRAWCATGTFSAPSAVTAAGGSGFSEGVLTMFRKIRSLMALAAIAICAACAAPPTVDQAAQLSATLTLARTTFDAYASSHNIPAAKVAEVRAQVDAAISLLATVGPIASIADPKLAPALAALNGLNETIAAANAAAAPPPAASGPSS